VAKCINGQWRRFLLNGGGTEPPRGRAPGQGLGGQGTFTFASPNQNVRGTCPPIIAAPVNDDSISKSAIAMVVMAIPLASSLAEYGFVVQLQNSQTIQWKAIANVYTCNDHISLVAF